MKSTIKSKSGKVFSAKKTSVFFGVLLSLVLAISYSCKKNTPTENPPNQLRNNNESTNGLISQIDGYKQNVIIRFSGAKSASLIEVSNDNVGKFEDLSESGSNVKYNFSTGIVTFDGIKDTITTVPTNYTLTFSVQGDTNGTFVIPITLQKAKLIVETGIESNDSKVSLASIMTNFGVDKGEVGFSNNSGAIAIFNFTNTNAYQSNFIGFTNTRDNSNIEITNVFDKFKDYISTKTILSNYFSSIEVSYLKESEDKAELYYKAVFVPHWSNEMSNANNMQIIFVATNTQAKNNKFINEN